MAGGRAGYVRIALVAIVCMALYLIASSDDSNLVPSLRSSALDKLSTATDGSLSSPNLRKRKVPSIVHYVWETQTANETMSLSTFMAMSSAIMKLKPQTIRFQYRPTPPVGFWWDRIIERLDEYGTDLVLVPAREVTEIFGNKLHHRAHKTDIIRMESVREFGGVYLDLDVYVLKDWDDLYHHSTVMGEQAWGLDMGHDLGLCNAIIVAEPHAPFIEAWYDAYRNFSDEPALYLEHSVALPGRMAQEGKYEIHTLNRYQMFWPTCLDHQIRFVHTTLMHNFKGQYAYHAWHNAMRDPTTHLDRDYLDELTPESVWKAENSFDRMAKDFLSENLILQYQAAKADGTFI